MRFIICTNPEIMSDGTYLATRGSSIDVRAVTKAVERIVVQVDDCDYDCDSFFAHWKGGKYDQFYSRCGLVAYPQGSGPEVEAMAERLDDAIRAEIGAQDLAEQMDDCRYFADGLESGEADLELFLSDVAGNLIPARTGDDKQSVVDALRVRLAERK
jgi:hypothetical protein